MRLSQTPPSLLSLLFVVLSRTHTVHAGPFPKDDLHDLGYAYLMDRQCVSYCGYNNMYCCSAGEACYTNAENIATCTAVAGGGGAYGVYTTVYTETDLVLRTSTYTSWYAQATPTAVAPAVCTPSLGQSSCGTICCAGDQRCAAAGTCTPYSSYYVTSTSAAGSAPYRPTSGGIATATSTVSATTTAPFISPATASGSTLPITSSSSNNGLSPGAIAGIVIGVIAGITLLLLFCFCCILKAGFDGLLALFGLGKRKRRSTERVEVIEERYSRHGSGTGRAAHSTWFGAGRPATVTESRKKKSSGFGGLGYVGAGLLGLAAVLGLKRRHDRKSEKPARSEVSSSYYSYTDTSAMPVQTGEQETRGERDTHGVRLPVLKWT
ncbi:hypothetical protein L207DRAFT_575213 [Hyaloscypha variabilis F]|uniref:Mid2 domain-containing protein n=1 Tax=Hyaloscypha variabilis (strain UAMH 11265 / GT02V1 / F) TaxID=1149755 RepID=A0A2J6SCQ7_HYAVF|nr:hypothetical protein L207DRAFT_575213 [Hyaloscypha variabilis F]